MSVLGNRVLRTEDPRMLTVGARYVADLRLDGAARAWFVRSSVARGRLTGVDTAEARRQPGVLGVFTAADLGLPDLKPVPVVDQRMTRPVLACDTVRFVGEPVVVIVAETAAAAADAAEKVVVDIEPESAVAALPDAATGNTLVHQDAGTNIAFNMPAAGHGGDPPDFTGCEVTVGDTLVNRRLAAVPLEPRSAAAEWSAAGTRLTFYASTQAPAPGARRPSFPVRARQGRGPGGDPRRWRRLRGQRLALARGARAGRAGPRRRPVGGMDRVPGREPRLPRARAGPRLSGSAWAAPALDGSPTTNLKSFRMRAPYPMIGAFLPTYTRKVFTGCYRIANASISGQSLVTNTRAGYRLTGARAGPRRSTPSSGPWTCTPPGSGWTPAEVRRLNFVAPESFPYTNPAGSTYDTGNFGEALDRALAAARYDDLRAEQASPPGRRRPDAARHRHRLVCGEHLDGSQRTGRDRASGRWGRWWCAAGPPRSGRATTPAGP